MSKSNEQEALSGMADGAQSLAGPHTGRGAGPTIPLAALDGHHVTVRLSIAGQSVLVKGWAAYEKGTGVSISLDDEVLTEILLAESSWNGLIVQDPQSGRDYLICLDAQAAASKAAS